MMNKSSFFNKLSNSTKEKLTKILLTEIRKVKPKFN